MCCLHNYGCMIVKLIDALIQLHGTLLSPKKISFANAITVRLMKDNCDSSFELNNVKPKCWLCNTFCVIRDKKNGLKYFIISKVELP